MSFSDFKGSSSRSSAVKRPTTSAGAVTATSGKKDPLGSISESLLQYQRNVGILEKIVQSLTAATANTASSRSSRAASRSELEMQYKAQVDVIHQLEGKLLTQLQHQKQTAIDKDKTTLIKLSRDFERVQARAKQFQEKVARWHKQEAAAAVAVVDETANTMASENSAEASQQNYYEQMQLQLEEDRLNEEIMREREEEIRNINRGMHQVNEIYKDLAHIVGSQQEQIDSIETQMEDSRANAESGLTQIEKANEKFGSAQCTIS